MRLKDAARVESYWDLHDIRGVIFDWAGTTIDHGSIAPVKAVMQAFSQFGIEVSEAEAREPMGRSKIDHIQAVLRMPNVVRQWTSLEVNSDEGSWVERIYARFLQSQKQILEQHSVPIAGVVEGVAFLRSQGIRIGSTTGYTRALMDVVIPVAASHGYSPDSLVCADDVAAGRPAPWMNFRAAEMLGIFPMEHFLIVDDSLVGIQAAKNAGAIAVGVSLTGNEFGLSAQQLEQLPDSERDARQEAVEKKMLEAGADLVVDSVAELIYAIGGSRLKK